MAILGFYSGFQLGEQISTAEDAKERGGWLIVLIPVFKCMKTVSHREHREHREVIRSSVLSVSSVSSVSIHPLPRAKTRNLIDVVKCKMRY
jgi:hypothetical protein